MSGESVQYLVCDALRFGDLRHQDTAAMTAEQARPAAADMAVLGVVGIVECPARDPQWVRPVPANGACP